MPPPKGSNKAQSTQDKLRALAEQSAPEKVQLFPPGYKTPLSLLNERCQKENWEKASVDARKSKDDPSKWTAVVTLRRRNNKTGTFDAVILRPPPPPSPICVEMGSALEARHFAAVYALFRCFNHLRLNLQLPPQTRPYWSALEKEKAESPPNKDWMWSATPFEEAAKSKQIAESRQAADKSESRPMLAGSNGSGRANSGREGVKGGSGRDNDGKKGPASHVVPWSPIPEERLPPHWRDAPQLKMSPRLRELIEATIKASVPTEQELGVYAGMADDGRGGERHSDLLASFMHYGFRQGYVERAIKFVHDVRAVAKLLDQNRGPVGRLLEEEENADSEENSDAESSVALSGGFTGLPGDSASPSGTLTPSPPSLNTAILHAMANQPLADAVLEALLLNTPEEDLPPAFARSRPSDAVARIVAPKTSLASSWMADRIAQQYGFPADAATKWLAEGRDRVGVVIDLIFRRLLATVPNAAAHTDLDDAELLSPETYLAWITAANDIPRENEARGTIEHPEKRNGKLSTSRSKALASLGVTSLLPLPQGSPLALLSAEELELLAQRRRDEMETLEGLYGSRFRRCVRKPSGDVVCGKVVSDDAILKDGSVLSAFDLVLGAGDGDGVTLRVVYHAFSLYPCEPHLPAGAAGDVNMQPILHLPTFYIISPTLPAYLRLHITALAASHLRTDPACADLARAGDGGVVAEMADFIETALPDVLSGRLPDARAVYARLSGAGRGPARYAIRNRGEGPKERSSRSARAAAAGRGSARTGAYMSRVAQLPAYKAMLEVREKLPAFAQRETIVETIRNNRCVIVAGETGSGKTTQVPAFVLDAAIESQSGDATRIIVTQPRRVSAIGVAERVAAERCETVAAPTRDSLVGYAIRGERKAGPGCRLLFCTTGVVLAKLSRGDDPDLRGVSHIFVDEVHERSVDSDFLLVELRSILKRNPKIHVILMSATIDQARFSAFFGGAPCITIPGRTHPVQDLYLEDVLPDWLGRYGTFTVANRPRGKMNQDDIDRMEAGFGNVSNAAKQVLGAITRAGCIEYTAVGMAVRHCVELAEGESHSDVVGSAENASRKGGVRDSAGDILVFMPGVMEIQQAIEAIRGHAGSKMRDRLLILPLHANLSSDEQRAVFKPTPAGMRKVVVATNVAETSITIDGIVYVIDSGRVKENTFDPVTGVVKLVETWTSQASSRQRRGRAGRTRPGVCIKLFTRYTEEMEQAPAPRPEMTRIPLEQLCLQIKAMRPQADVQEYLSSALDPPDVRAIEKAWETLLDLSVVQDGDGHSKFSGLLTPLGKHLSLLPVDLRLGKMLVLACVFKCVDRVLTMAGLLSSKPLFLTPMERREESKAARKRYYTAHSDIITDVMAFEALFNARKELGASKWRNLADEMCISMSAFRDIVAQKSEYYSALKSVGFIPASTRATADSLNTNGDNTNLLKAILFAGMSSKKLVKVKLPKSVFDKGLTGAIERDKEAREIKFFEWDDRVFVHPNSLLFAETHFESRFATYFSKAVTSKPFLRDLNEVPLYGVLLFGNGPVMLDVDRGAMGVGAPLTLSADKTVASSQLSHAEIESIERRARQGARKTDPWVVVRAWPRAAVLVSILRRLFDADLEAHLDDTEYAVSNASPVIDGIVKLLEKDGR